MYLLCTSSTVERNSIVSHFSTLHFSPSFNWNNVNKSLKNMLNRIGELTAPCCSPSRILNSFEHISLSNGSHTKKHLLWSITHRKRTKCVGKPFLINLKNKLSSHTVSNAFSRSIQQASTNFLSFNAQHILDVSLLIA